jgi:hypothetical protein
MSLHLQSSFPYSYTPQEFAVACELLIVGSSINQQFSGRYSAASREDFALKSQTSHSGSDRLLEHTDCSSIS